MTSRHGDPQHASIGRSTYEHIGHRYGEIVDTKPFNAYYERPATLSLIPSLTGLHVLDVGSGNGWYAEYLLAQGAHVTAMDVSPTMVGLTQARVGQRITVHVADLADPLSFAQTATFDLVLAPLVLHYLEHWEPVLAEFHRVLLPNGILIFSTDHPTADFERHPASNYFATQLVEEEWGSLGTVRFYRRPMSAVVNALAQSGFCIEHLLEPQPTSAFQQVDPDDYEQLMRFPSFIVIRARRL